MENKFEWQLDKDFQLSSDMCRKKMEEIRLEVTSFSHLNRLKSKVSLFHFLEEYWRLKEQIDLLLRYASLSYYQLIGNEQADLKLNVEHFQTEMSVHLEHELMLALENLKEEDLEGFPSYYHYFLKEVIRNKKFHVKSESLEQYQKNQTQLHENVSRYHELLHHISYGTIEDKNKIVELNISNLGKYLASNNRSLRKQAYLESFSHMKEYESSFSEILQNILQYRINNSILLGFSNCLEEALFKEDLQEKIITDLIKLTHEQLPLLREYFSLKRQFLGYDEFHIYDVSTSFLSTNQKKYSLEEAECLLLNALAPLGERYITILKQLLNTHHFDASLREGKHQSITFSWHEYSFMNFHGSYIDLKNMAHEMGHMVNAYLSKQKQPFMYMDSTVFTGELASITNELLLNRYLSEQANTTQEKIFYLSKNIESFIQLVYKQVMYVELEECLHENHLSISETYFHLFKNYYGNSITYDEISEIGWIQLGHLFRHNYYSYQYATGYIMATSFLKSYLDDKIITEEQYIHFLESGSSRSSLELLKELGLDITSKEMLKKGFQYFKNDFETLKNLLRKLD